MRYRVPTDVGDYILREPYATVGVAVSSHEEFAGFRNQKINDMLAKHEAELDGLVWICQERRELNGFVVWHQYFARPHAEGGFYFARRTEH